MKQERIQGILQKQKRYFSGNHTRAYSYRIRMLRRLCQALKAYETELFRALKRDLGKSKTESYMTEFAMVYQEIDYAIRKLRKWMMPKRVSGTIGTFPAKNYVCREPYGVVLILAPWNYPVNLSMIPLVGAIAAGNCVVLKCSETSPHTSRIIEKMINRFFPAEYIFCADKDTDYEEITGQEYDYIFYTGSARAGKLVMQTAAERLIPVTLELGGKCPCIVEKTADLSIAAKRIVWGKLLNAGQTCVSVDYVLADRQIKEELIRRICGEIERHYRNALNDEKYPKIINAHHFERLLHLMDSQKRVIGGEYSIEKQKIAPAVFPEARWSDVIMKEEIFGPLLPVIGYDNPEQAILEITRRSKPLACYIFSRNEDAVRKVLTKVSAGSCCVNDAVLQLSNHHLPFGGVGMSGMGQYHGKYSFETFSHRKAVLENGSRLDVPLRYAPFGEWKYQLLRRLF